MLGAAGDSIPPGDPHGVSVSLPTWQDTVGWATRDPRILHLMKTGYPRFFIPRVVDELAERTLASCHSPGSSPRLVEDVVNGTRKGLVLQTFVFATLCKDFLVRKSVPAELVFIYSLSIDGMFTPDRDSHDKTLFQNPQFHVVSYPADHFKLAKAFWQHTGFGISSRCAEYWLQTLNFSDQCRARQKHNLPFAEAETCHELLCERLASLASADENPVTSQDVFLYPTGMSAISHTASAVMSMPSNKPCKVAVFGFLYVDTFKVLTTVYNLTYTLYGHATTSEIDDLETSLSTGDHISALYLEFPGNPLLQSPDLVRLHTLSKKYNFLLVVDDTVGTTVNLTLLPHCDVLATSLTKMFSGACNVMGGSLVLNPHSPSHSPFHTALTQQYNNAYFPHDIITMESNSRDFPLRVLQASTNASRITSILRASPLVTRIYYPEHSATQPIYDAFKRNHGGYGFLLSIIFQKSACAVAFYDALDVAKGPSLGTNFTLACAYTLLAHYGELEWAAEHGVVEYLVRISVGVEEEGVLVGVVERALEKAGEVDRERDGGLVV